ncbi:MAG: S41 family peptidase [Phycisphaerales bacterium]
MLGDEPVVIASAGEKLFDEAWESVRKHFYDKGLHGVDWDEVRTELGPRARQAATRAEVSAIINAALDRLRASHTRHYTPQQREYYELLDVFFSEGVPEREGSALKPGPVEYVGIGLAAARIEERVFVYDVYTGGPADAAGILPGDELVGVEDGPWGDVEPFRGREGMPTRVKVRRERGGETAEVVATPARISPRRLFLSALREGARVHERDGKRIGYVRVRSYAHPCYHEALRECLTEKLAEADALVLDFRGGWGGASPDYMDLFDPRAIPALTFGAEQRRYPSSPSKPVWSKPLAVLIDGGTRSGKEVLAHAFKKHRLGTLVGGTTAGAVLGGGPHVLGDGSLLLLVGSDVRVDGEKLEGVGVEPDVPVARLLPYSAGADPQLERAFGVLTGRAAAPAP